jgi:hypothetical protein
MEVLNIGFRGGGVDRQAEKKDPASRYEISSYDLPS